MSGVGILGSGSYFFPELPKFLSTFNGFALGVSGGGMSKTPVTSLIDYLKGFIVDFAGSLSLRL
jgi:hypothetical protein